MPGNGVPKTLADGTKIPNLNQGKYASEFENRVRELAANPNNKVEVIVEPVYRSGNATNRPDEFLTRYRVNGGGWFENRFNNKAGG